MSLNGTLDGSEFLPQHASVIFPNQNFILASAAKLTDENTEWIGGDLIVGEILYFVMYRSLIEIVTEPSATPTATRHWLFWDGKGVAACPKQFDGLRIGIAEALYTCVYALEWLGCDYFMNTCDIAVLSRPDEQFQNWHEPQQGFVWN